VTIEIDEAGARRFTLTVEGLPPEALTVIEFAATEEISRPYKFSITAVSGRDDLEIMDRGATFTIRGLADRGTRFSYHGAITRCEYFYSLAKPSYYRVTMEPRLTRLARTRHSDAYLDEETIPELVSRILREGGAAYALTGRDVDLRTVGTDYRQRSCVYRHDESCLAFLSRHLEHEGMYYHFRQEEDREVMVITDDRISHAPATRTVLYRITAGDGRPDNTIHTLVMEQTCLPAAVILKGHNFRKSTLDLTVSHPVSGTGTGELTISGENYRTPEEGRRYAKIRAEELACRGRIFSGAGTAVGIMSGTMLNIAGHDHKAFNGEYLVLTVHHSGSQAGAVLTAPDGKNDHYTAAFTCIPASVQYRPERTTPVPVISGSLTAVIDGDGSGSHAELDEHGRYKVRFPGKEEKQGARNWAWIRMATPYAGSEEGMHFPLRKGTEVLLTFINGHPDNPVIAAAVPNSERKSVVTGRNAMTHALQTNAVNGLFMTAAGGVKSAEEISLRNLGQDPPPPTRNEEFHWTKYVTGDEQNIIKGSSATAYLNNRLTLNGGANVTVNALTMATNINAGTTMNLNLAPSVTYQVADTLTTGPGKVYSANQSYKTVGLDSIRFVAGLDGAERTKCLRGWQALTFAAATLLGMAASIVPAVYNHFSPEDRLKPQHQALGAYAASSFMFLSYWVGSRARDGFDMAVPKDRSGMPIIDQDLLTAPNRFGGTMMVLDNRGFSVFGARQISEHFGLTGAEREGLRPFLSVTDGSIFIHAEEGGGRDQQGFLRSSIDMSLGKVHLQGGQFGSIISDIEALHLQDHSWAIRLARRSLRLGDLASVTNDPVPGQSLINITTKEVETTGETVRIRANGVEATFDAKGTLIGSPADYLRVGNGQGVEISGKKLRFQAGTVMYLE
jgi:type VI secretion system VgrG family protein